MMRIVSVIVLLCSAVEVDAELDVQPFHHADLDNATLATLGVQKVPSSFAVPHQRRIPALHPEQLPFRFSTAQKQLYPLLPLAKAPAAERVMRAAAKTEKEDLLEEAKNETGGGWFSWRLPWSGGGDEAKEEDKEEVKEEAKKEDPKPAPDVYTAPDQPESEDVDPEEKMFQYGAVDKLQNLVQDSLKADEGVDYNSPEAQRKGLVAAAALFGVSLLFKPVAPPTTTTRPPKVKARKKDDVGGGVIVAGGAALAAAAFASQQSQKEPGPTPTKPPTKPSFFSRGPTPTKPPTKPGFFSRPKPPTSKVPTRPVPKAPKPPTRTPTRPVARRPARPSGPSPTRSVTRRNLATQNVARKSKTKEGGAFGGLFGGQKAKKPEPPKRTVFGRKGKGKQKQKKQKTNFLGNLFGSDSLLLSSSAENFDQSSPAIISISAAVLSGLFVGSAVTFAARCFRRGALTADEEPFLGA